MSKEIQIQTAEWGQDAQTWFPRIGSFLTLLSAMLATVAATDLVGSSWHKWLIVAVSVSQIMSSWLYAQVKSSRARAAPAPAPAPKPEPDK
jgi:hypothetical protein